MKKSFIKYAKGSVFNSVFWSVKCVKIVGFVYYSGILKLLTLSLHLHRQCLADNVFTICCFMSLHYIYVQSSIGRVSVCLSVCCAGTRSLQAVCTMVGAAATVRSSSFTAAQMTMRDVVDCQLAAIRDSGTWKSERIIVTSQGPSIRVHGRHAPLLNFCANNYLGLSVSKITCLSVCHASLHSSLITSHTLPDKSHILYTVY